MNTILVRNGARVSDLVDFISRGVFEGLDSHPLLDTEYYAAQRPDVATALAGGEPALVHYRSFGAAEGVNPHPLFDTNFYLRQAPETLRPGLPPGSSADPLSHYLEAGWREGLDPHPLFSTTYYLQHSPDVAQAGVQPLLHYIQGGQYEGRATSPYFDAPAYLRHYPEVASSGLTPLLHYLLHGAAKGYRAGPLADFRIASDPSFNRPFGVLDLAAADEDSYYAWVRASRRLPAAWRARALALAAGFRYRPPVSLLLHLGAERAEDARASVRSVQDQLYTDWQLCIAIDPDVPPGVQDWLSGAAAQNRRLQLIRRGTSEEPAFALNAALDAATGAYAGLLGAGDRLHPLALSTLVGALQDEQRPALAYADEDVLDPAGHHCDPVFKPDWSPDLLLGLDYICRGSLVQTRLMRSLGGMRAGFDGAGDYDLVLRLAARLGPGSAVHVPRPLYHRQAWADAAADRASQARNDGMYRALKAATTNAATTNAATPNAATPNAATIVRGRAPGHFSVAFEPAAGPEPLVSIVIPTANAFFPGPLGPESVLQNCIRSLREGTAWKALEIVVVHDDIDASQLDWLRQHEVILVEYKRPAFNFSEKINLGVRASHGEYVVLLNDDIEAKRPDWLRLLLGWLQRPGVGVVGPKLFFPDGRLQHTGIVLQHGNPGHLYYRAGGGDPGYLEMNGTARNWLAVTGACQMIRRALFDQAGGYDEGLPLNFNDVDFCLRVIELGQRVVYVPQAELYHFEGVTKLVEIGTQATTPYETDFFQARWRARYPADPFYHPDLPPWQPLGLCQPDDVRRTPSEARKLPAPALLAARTAGVNWMGPVNRSSGLGTASRSYLAALQQAGLKTRIVPLDKLFGHQALVGHSLPSTQQDFAVTMVHANADLTTLLFDHYGDELARARYRIALWVWELPAARPEWQRAARRYDEIWVPSTFCQTAFKAITDVPVTVMPYALADLPTFGAADRAACRATFDIPDHAFVFL